MVFAQRSQIFYEVNNAKRYFYEVKNAKRHFLRSKQREAVFLAFLEIEKLNCSLEDIF